ncbi:MAG: hypothetical protein ABJJ53_19500 [Sulfitobacter sp.]
MKASHLKLMTASAFALGLGTAAHAGDFAQAAYTTPLADVCPNPLVIQKDWLMQAEHGGLMQLIGAGGEMVSGSYSGPLGSTGITLELLEGGSGIGLGDGETSYSALFMGNSKAGKRPHLGFHELDNSFIYSERFPTVGVFVPLDVSPQVLFWDKGTYPDGFKTIEDLKAFGASGKGKIYLSTIDRTFGKFFVDSGVPADTFVEGYRGDGENFVVNNGTWLNQGFVTSEVYKFENGNNWSKPIGAVGINDLGYPNYTGILAVAKDRLEELAPCLEKVVPLMQQASIDYIKDPAEVLDVVVAFNEGGFGTGWWKTSPELAANGAKKMGELGIVGNGNNDTVGDFDMEIAAQMAVVVAPSLDERSDMDVTPQDVVTNRFIDPSIGF